MVRGPGPTWSTGDTRYWSEGASALGPSQRWSAPPPRRRQGEALLRVGSPAMVQTGAALSTSSVVDTPGISSLLTRAESVTLMGSKARSGSSITIVKSATSIPEASLSSTSTDAVLVPNGGEEGKVI